MPLATIDYTALTAQASKEGVKAYLAQERAKPDYRAQANTIVQVILFLAFFAFFGTAVLGLLVNAVFDAISAVREGQTLGILGLIVPLAIVALFALIARSLLANGWKWRRWYRLDAFAKANGLVFSRLDPNPAYPGLIFGIGDTRCAIDHLGPATGRYFDYGNYRYSTGSGKSRTIRTWGYLALHLDRALPNMVLDSKANNGLFGGTNLPTVFDKSQVLHLEGDFDKYFTLYCPKQYEQDALYVFTPDLMALLIDEASPFDVEIVDDWVFVYSNTQFNMALPSVHERLFRIIDTVGAKTLNQTHRYSDDRVQDFAANIVAPQGQRLKRGISIGAILFSAVFVILWAMPWIVNLVGWMSG